MIDLIDLIATNARRAVANHLGRHHNDVTHLRPSDAFGTCLYFVISAVG